MGYILGNYNNLGAVRRILLKKILVCQLEGLRRPGEEL